MDLFPWDNGIPSIYRGDINQNAWMVAHLNSDYPQVSLVRLDGSNWRVLPLYLYDIGITKDRDGVTDLIIGVSVDRRGIFLYNPATGSLENTMIYDTGDVGSIFRPTMGGGHTIVFSMVRNNTMAVWKMERGDGGSVQGLVNNACNACISIDGSWFACSAASGTWKGWQGEALGWHQEILSYNIGGDYTNLTGGAWLTAPWQNANYPDCDYPTFGQWSPSYGEYYVAMQCGRFMDPGGGAPPVDFANADNFPSGHADLIAIWCPNPAGGTYHISNWQRNVSDFTPYQAGFWVGAPSPLRCSKTREEQRGDPGWLTAPFVNPWGMGMVTYAPRQGSVYQYWMTLYEPFSVAMNGSRGNMTKSHNSRQSSIMYDWVYPDEWGVYHVGYDPGYNVWSNGGI